MRDIGLLVIALISFAIFGCRPNSTASAKKLVAVHLVSGNTDSWLSLESGTAIDNAVDLCMQVLNGGGKEARLDIYDLGDGSIKNASSDVANRGLKPFSILQISYSGQKFVIDEGPPERLLILETPATNGDIVRSTLIKRMSHDVESIRS